MRKWTITLAALVFAATFLPAHAAFANDTDNLMRQFVRPRLLMRYQKELGLTAKQKEAIKNHVKEAQAKSVDVQFELSQEMQKLQDLVSKDKVDRKAAIAQAQKVMDLETKMKSLQLGLMIDVKNELTPKQIEQIKEYRKSQRTKRPQRWRR